jgi:ABC-type hemin transport system substrate-binding protein
MRKFLCACIILLLVICRIPRSVYSIQPPFYATLGIESYSILRELVGTDHVIAIRNGTMPDVLSQHKIAAFVIPENRQDDPDVVAAGRAGVPIVTVLRHTSIDSITANITTLGKLSHQDEKADRWVTRVNTELLRLQNDIRDMPQVRVLVLSPEGYTQGNGALITNLLSLIKGINVAAEEGIPEARQISDEQIRQFAPEVVLLLNWSPELASQLMSNPLYNGIPAFDHQRIYRITSPGKDITQLTNDIRSLSDLIHIWLF